MDENFPCFVTLMDDHNEASYDEILNKLMQYAKEHIDPKYARLTAKKVRIMGDWSMAEHKAMRHSQHIQIKSDDGCGWHLINAINDNMKTRNVIELYYHCEDFRRFIRYFETLRGIHFDCADVAFKLIRIKS